MLEPKDTKGLKIVQEP
jgi:hypothetical protein